MTKKRTRRTPAQMAKARKKEATMTKEDIVAVIDEIVDSTVQQARTPQSKGLGDTIAKFTEATGIDKLVKFIAGEDCGCDERKKKLNEMFQYRFKVKCLQEEEYNILDRFFSANPKSIKPSEQRELNKIHINVFGYEEGTCDGCVRSMVNKLKTVYEAYEVIE